MEDSTEQQPPTPQPTQTPFNAVSLAMILSIAGFGYWGYHSELFPDGWGQFLGVIVGFFVAILATPIVFLALMLLIHCVIRLED
jgi:hypothetical protein